MNIKSTKDSSGSFRVAANYSIGAIKLNIKQLKTMQITLKYNLVWQLKTSPNYQFTDDGICINVKRGKQVRKVVVSGTKGYCINGKFKSVLQLRKEIIKIEKINCPF